MSQLTDTRTMGMSTLYNELENRAQWTPDFHVLRFKKEIPIFVYCDFKRLGSDNKFLDGARFLGNAMTVSDKFKMLRGPDYPIVLEEKVYKHYPIFGEAYLISPQHILDMDQSRYNSMFFNRRMENIYLLEQQHAPGLMKTKGIEAMSCYMYVAKKDDITAVTTFEMNPRPYRWGMTPHQSQMGDIARSRYVWDLHTSVWPDDDERPAEDKKEPNTLLDEYDDNMFSMGYD